MNNIYIITVFNVEDNASYTHNTFFTDIDDTTNYIASMASYVAAQTGRVYSGYIKDEDGYCITKDQKVEVIYSIQTLVEYKTDSVQEGFL